MMNYACTRNLHFGENELMIVKINNSEKKNQTKNKTFKKYNLEKNEKTTEHLSNNFVVVSVGLRSTLFERADSLIPAGT